MENKVLNIYIEIEFEGRYNVFESLYNDVIKSYYHFLHNFFSSVDTFLFYNLRNLVS